MLSWRVLGSDIHHCFFRNQIPRLKLPSGFFVQYEHRTLSGAACLINWTKSKFRHVEHWKYKTSEYTLCVCVCGVSVCELSIIPWSPSQGPSDMPLLTLDTGARTAQAPRQPCSTYVVPAPQVLNKQGQLSKTKEWHGSTGISVKSSDLLYS